MLSGNFVRMMGRVMRSNAGWLVYAVESKGFTQGM
jgi:hypothetical protein